MTKKYYVLCEDEGVMVFATRRYFIDLGVANEYAATISMKRNPLVVPTEGTDVIGYEEHSFRNPATDNMATMIAHKFVSILRRDLTQEQFFEMCVRNATAEPGVCHSHDFCDANMVMEEAFHGLGLATSADIDAESNPNLNQAKDEATDLWNEAWTLAMPLIGGK